MAWEVQITVFRDDAPHLTASFDRSPITLGARPYNDIVLNDPFVSGEHAQVMVSRGELVYRDQSTNGSFFDGRRISEQNLGQRGRVAIPPFEIELSFEIEAEDTWKTAYRRDLSDLLPDRQAPGLEPPAAEAPPAAEPPPAAASPPVRSPWERSVPVPGGPPEGKPTLELDAGGPASGPQDDRQTLPPGEVPPASTPPAADPQGTPDATAAHDRFHLRVVAGPAELQDRLFALPPRPVRLGRGDACDVRLPVETVSRSHAVLRPLGGASWLLVDAGSANGCYVAGEQVKEAELAAGDQFRLGDVDLQLFLGGSAVEPTAPPPEPPPISKAGIEELEIYPSALPISPPPPAPQGALTVAVEAVTGDPSAVVAEVAGCVDSYSYTQLADALDRAVDDGARFLVVDLSGVTFISHTGLGVLVKSLVRLKPLRGDLRLVGLSQRLLDALSMSHLDSLFAQRLAATRQEALAAWVRS